jgi:hypothetical protein
MMFFSWSASPECAVKSSNARKVTLLITSGRPSGATCSVIHYKTHHVAGNRMKSVRWTVEVSCIKDVHFHFIDESGITIRIKQNLDDGKLQMQHL